MDYQIRACPAKLETRDAEDGTPVIEGYFAVFGDVYQMWDDASESIAPGAFAGTLGNDIRALTNHDTTLVLGRNTAGTLELREDTHGLWGRILIDPDDGDAMNLYARVKRGNVSQCSIGFNVIREETEILDGGGVHWTLLELDLHEVSVCTFPAYEGTAVQARKHDYEDIQKRKRQAWRETMTKRLKGEAYGTESTDAV